MSGKMASLTTTLTLPCLVSIAIISANPMLAAAGDASNGPRWSPAPLEEMAKPAERLRDAYVSYIGAKTCYELPRNKEHAFITEAEIAAVKKAVAAKEKHLEALEPLDTEQVWKLAQSDTFKLAIALRVLEQRPDSEFREFCHSFVDELLSLIDPFGAYDVKKDF